MDWVEKIDWKLLSAIVASIGGILAWIAKLRWSDEYSKAKDETIKAKDAYIDMLQNTILQYKELTPQVIWEQYSSLAKIKDQFIEALKQELAAANEALSKKNKQGLKKDVDILNRNVEVLTSNKQIPFEEIIASTSGSAINISKQLGRGTAVTINELSNALLLTSERIKGYSNNPTFSYLNGKKVNIATGVESSLPTLDDLEN